MTQQVNITPLSCAEFQERLPEFFSKSSGVADDPSLQAHLDTCENCSTLVRDLQYIADQVELYLEPAEEEPSDAVWTGLQDKLAAERAEGISIPPLLPS